LKAWAAEQLAEKAGAQLIREATHGGDMDGMARGPRGICIDTRRLAPGDLFVGLVGSREDGGVRAREALEKGAWGVLVTAQHAKTVAEGTAEGAVLAHVDPLAGLQALARAWRGELVRAGAKVVAITGSTGKTSTKDILAALLRAQVATASSPENLNTEIGLPLAILAAPEGTEALVLEMAMRGQGQIAELTEIADPDVGVIVNVGPAHLELLGSLANIAAAKAELIAGMRPGCTIVLPVGEPLLAPHVRADLHTVTFGAGGDVSLLREGSDGHDLICHDGEEIDLQPSFGQAHNLRNLLAAVAVVRTLGYTPSGRLDVDFSAMRGQRISLGGGVLLIDDCYNANPMSVRAALEDLAARLLRTAEEVTGRAKSTARVQMHVTGTNHPLDPDVERELTRIAREAVANAVRHGDAENIVLRLEFEGSMFGMEIRDDGRGFAGTPPDGTTGHFGLTGMRERASAIGATLTVESNPGTGTAVRLALGLGAASAAETEKQT